MAAASLALAAGSSVVMCKLALRMTIRLAFCVVALVTWVVWLSASAGRSAEPCRMVATLSAEVAGASELTLQAPASAATMAMQGKTNWREEAGRAFMPTRTPGACTTFHTVIDLASCAFCGQIV